MGNTFLRRLTVGIMLAGATMAGAHAEQVIRIGIQDDPDMEFRQIVAGEQASIRCVWSAIAAAMSPR
jgi:hypothetical protein